MFFSVPKVPQCILVMIGVNYGDLCCMLDTNHLTRIYSYTVHSFITFSTGILILCCASFSCDHGS